MLPCDFLPGNGILHRSDMDETFFSESVSLLCFPFVPSRTKSPFTSLKQQAHVKAVGTGVQPSALRSLAAVKPSQPQDFPVPF